MLSHRNKIQRTAIEESYTRFRSVKPISDGIFKRVLKRMRSATVKILAATMIFTSFGNFYSCSNQEPTSDYIEPTPVLIDKNGQGSSITDSKGLAVFEVNGNRYEVRIIDGETEKPIVGLTVSLSLEGSDSGLYVVIDPEGVYQPRLGELGQNFSGKEDSHKNGNYKKTLVTYKKETVCTGIVEHYGGISPTFDNMSKIFEWAEDYYENKNIKNPLTDNFEPKGTVTLAELNDKIKTAQDALKNQLFGEVRDEGLLIMAGYLIGKKLAESMLGPVFAINAVLDACPYVEKNTWADYYTSMCYSPTDEFDIWVLKLDEGKTNSKILLIIPKKSKDNWEPPTAEIKGNVKLEEGKGADWGAEVKVRHFKGIFPSGSYPHHAPPFWYNEGDHFDFVVSACDIYDPTYEIGIGKTASPAYDNPSMTLTVEENKVYIVNFKLKNGCGTANYKVKKVGENTYEVSCGGKNAFNCSKLQSSGVHDGTSSNPPLNKINEINLHEVGGCLARDQDGNFYVGARPVSEFGLHKFDENLNVIWSLPGLGFRTSVISANGFVHTLDSSGFTYQVSPSSEVLWKFDKSSNEQLAAIASEGTLYAVSSSTLSAISSGGELKWSYKSPVGSELDTVAVNYDGSVHVLSKDTGYVLTVEPNTGQELWKFKAPQNTHSDISILSDGTIVVGSSTTLYGIAPTGEVSWEFSDNVPLNFTNPTVNADEGLYFFGWHPDCTESLLYLSVTPGVSKNPAKIKQDFAPSTPPTVFVEPYLNENGEIEEINGLAMPGEDSDSRCSPVIGLNGGIYSVKGFYSATPVLVGHENQNARLSNSSWPMSRHDPQNTGNAATPIK